MKRTLLCLALAAVGIGVPDVSAQSRGDRSRSETRDSGSGYDQYEVLVDRNMFLRERRRPRQPTTQTSPTTAPTTTVAPETPEQRYVLRGVVIEDNELRAYFENVRTGEGMRVRPSEPIGSGHVAEIRIDAVAYASPEGRIVWVDVGHNLNGVRDVRSPAPAAPAAAASPDASAAATPGAAPATGPTDPALLSIEERLRLRRQQQRGGASGPTGGR